MSDDFLEIPGPKYLGRRRQSTAIEIAAFQEAISFKKDELEEEKEIDEVSKPKP